MVENQVQTDRIGPVRPVHTRILLSVSLHGFVAVRAPTITSVANLLKPAMNQYCSHSSGSQKFEICSEVILLKSLVELTFLLRVTQNVGSVWEQLM